MQRIRALEKSMPCPENSWILSGAPAIVKQGNRMGFQIYCRESAQLLEQTALDLDASRIEHAIDAIVRALRANKPLLLCGNGGSAADAMHIAAELAGRFRKERRGLKAICLGADTAFLTAWANDYSYETVFARQVEALGEAGGVLLGLSTSGNSPNVVKAFEEARRIGMTTIAMTGEGGGRLAAHADILLDVPSRVTAAVQQVHICIYHYLCDQVETRYAP